MSETMPITDKAECIGLIGPMKLAWEQTFQPGMNSLAPCLVIVWHSEWMYPHCKLKLWNALHEKLSAIRAPTRILVIIFGETPDDLGEEDLGNPLGALLRALSEDADDDSGCGWAAISDVTRFRSASVKWKGPTHSALLRLCNTCIALCDHWNPNTKGTELAPAPTLSEFFQFLSDPASFRTRRLHDKRDDATQGLRVLKWLASHSTIPRSLPLNILLVENRPGALEKLQIVTGIESDVSRLKDATLSAANLKAARDLRPFTLETTPLGFLKDAKIYLVSDNFDRLNSAKEREALKPRLVSNSANAGADQAPAFCWDEVDLVLQDIVLDDNNKKAGGLDLVSHYFEACPQALVFVLTSLDVESLVGSGDVNWRYVDCVVSKSALSTLWYEYWRCFRDRFGRMFWKPWVDASDRSTVPQLGDRQSLRDLFRCLRKWQLEPSILGHGQGVQEMIDHSHRHISEVWRLADDVLGTFLENCRQREMLDSEGKRCGEYLSVQSRMLFAMSVWLHDIGHRGDAFLNESGEIRANHAGISEYLLLRNPKAFGLDWLQKDYCRGACMQTPAGTKGNRLLGCRNALSCQQDEKGEICPIRKLGLMCRHHQSNAPLDENSLEYMSKKGKAPSPYSRVSTIEDTADRIDSQEELEAWLDPDLPLAGWRGSEVRRLDQFSLGEEKDGIVSCAGLLRILDALQLHRVRIGTPASIASFNAYLDTRTSWCSKELSRITGLIRAAVPGTKACQEVLAQYMRLRRYERLLNVQYVHYWRQIAVRDISVKWMWLQTGEAALRLIYAMDEWGLDAISDPDMKAVVPRAGNDSPDPIHLKTVLVQYAQELEDSDDDIRKWLADGNRSSLRNADKGDHLRLWAIQVRDDVIVSEHKSQTPFKKGERHAYVRFLPRGVAFEVATSGRTTKPLAPGTEVLLLERKDFDGTS